MRKTWLVLVALVVAFGLAGCNDSGGGNDPDPAGTWTLTTDWDCNGDPTAAILYIYSDATWEIPEEKKSGGWTLNGNTIMLVDTAGNIYTGTLEDDTLSGTVQSAMYSDGTRSNGCWDATRFVTTTGG